MTSTAWHRRFPEALQQVQRDLRGYPNLHAFELDECVEVRGTFPVRGVDGATLDSFKVIISLPARYPDALPVVREVGGRLPWKEEFHVNPGKSGEENAGEACVLIPDDRWRCFPVGAPFRRYLEGPLHNYFLGQLCFAKGEGWPFGQWDHGPGGVLEYYQHYLGTDDTEVILSFLAFASSVGLKRGLKCPCGSGKKVARCCEAKLKRLRRAIPRERASEAFRIVSAFRPRDAAGD